MLTRPYSLAMALLLSAAPLVAQQARPARVDTVDVPVGSKYVDFSKHTQSASRAVQSMPGRQSPVVIWRFVFTDTAGKPLLHVTSEMEGNPPGAEYTFNRRTLALLSVRPTGATPGPAPTLDVDGASIRGTMPQPGGQAVGIDATLPQPAFFGPLIDLVVESLPRRTGVVYRVPTIRPANPPTLETRLFQFVRREDVEVLGTTHKQAWLLRDLGMDGTVRGTMWLIDGPPSLVRWVINRPDGSTMTLDQQVASK